MRSATGGSLPALTSSASCGASLNFLGAFAVSVTTSGPSSFPIRLLLPALWARAPATTAALRTSPTRASMPRDRKVRDRNMRRSWVIVHSPFVLTIPFSLSFASPRPCRRAWIAAPPSAWDRESCKAPLAQPAIGHCRQRPLAPPPGAPSTSKVREVWSTTRIPGVSPARSRAAAGAGPFPRYRTTKRMRVQGSGSPRPSKSLPKPRLAQDCRSWPRRVRWIRPATRSRRELGGRRQDPGRDPRHRRARHRLPLNSAPMRPPSAGR